MTGKDAVNPEYYKEFGMEVYDIIGTILERFPVDFKHYQSYADLSNVLKYLLRLGAKEGDVLVDLGKAQWYLSKLLEREKEYVCEDKGAVRQDDTAPLPNPIGLWDGHPRLPTLEREDQSWRNDCRADRVCNGDTEGVRGTDKEPERSGKGRHCGCKQPRDS